MSFSIKNRGLFIKNTIRLFAAFVVIASVKMLYEIVVYSLYLQEIIISDVFKYAENQKGNDLVNYIQTYKMAYEPLIIYTVGFSGILLLLSALYSLIFKNGNIKLLYIIPIVIVFVPDPSVTLIYLIYGDILDKFMLLFTMLVNLIATIFGFYTGNKIKKKRLAPSKIIF